MGVLSSSLTALLDLPVLSRIRRNHGVEHATLHVLSQRYPRRSMAGYSDWRGFWILGDVSLDDVHSAVIEAVQRLKAGESHLAIHPNCGTSFVTSGMLAGIAAFLALFSAGRRFRDKLERLPLAATLATVALIVSRPLGLFLQQQVTTSADLGDLRVIEIIPVPGGPVAAYRILTRG